MADPLDPKPTGTEPAAPETPMPKPRRPRRKRSVKVDREKVSTFVMESLNKDLQDRDERIQRRKERWLKLHGYHVGAGKTFPWNGCADFYAPIMLIALRRMSASLENSAKAMRPTVEAKAIQARNREKEDHVNNLLDYQFYHENQGEKKLDDYATNFTSDEVAYWYVPWAREDETIREVRIIPAAFDETVEPIIQCPAFLKILFPTMVQLVLDPKDSSGYIWQVDFTNDEGEPSTARVEFYDTDDGKIEACITRDIRIFDGPAPQIVDYEDIVRPARCANLQPPNGANPHGAPYFHHICKIDLNTINRRAADGTFDLLSKDDLKEIKEGRSPTGSGQPEDEPKDSKDTARGDDPMSPGEGPDRQLIVTYAGWDVNGDGFEEQVIFWTIRLSATKGYVAAMRFLTEVYPGNPPMRPIAHESFFSETNRIDGYSFIEALETIQDMTEVSLNQHFDWGTITNMPVGFYRASSGMKPENLAVQPGDLIPLDDPSRDINYPQWPSRGETFNINTMSVLQQFAERLSMQSDLAFGRVPTGKSAALRTVGTTNALMSQIDVGSERALRRFFSGLAHMFQLMHRLNRRYLAKRKQIRIAGMPEAGADPYREIEPGQVDVDMDFEFKATMLNTNKQMMGQIMQQTIAMMVSPLAIQAGIVTPEEVYNAYRDYLKSNDLDPDRYARRPMTMIPGPKVTAEEAISAIVAGEAPIGSPQEPAMEHFQKLQMFQQTPVFLEMMQVAPLSAQLFIAWLTKVQQQVMFEQMQQAMMAQAAGGGPAGPGGSDGPGGAPTTVSSDTGTNPAVQPGEAIDESMMGGVQ